jgi:hypothetical protein
MASVTLICDEPKQTRATLTAYNKHKNQLKKQLKKQQESRKQSEKTTQNAAAVLEWLEKTGKKLGAIDTAAWTDEQKAALTKALASYQQTIAALIEGQRMTHPWLARP